MAKEFSAQKSFIHGRYVEHPSLHSWLNYHPATAEPLGPVEGATNDVVEQAVQSSVEGQKIWAGMAPAERSGLLLKAAQILRQRNDELAQLETLDTGKPIQETSAVDVISGAECLEYFSRRIVAQEGHHIPLGESFAYTKRVPLGVCAGIGAWNYPLQIACWKAAPALAAGNSMIFKPSELTPMTAPLLAEIFVEAGIPAGVFNVLQGAKEVGQQLSRHPKIAKISLTGEVGTGKAVMSDAASTLKHVTMELGGKSPMIIFGDCDLDEAVSGAMLGNFYSQGEICSNGTRVFVEESIYAEFLDCLKKRAEKLVVGDPTDPATQVGPLISEAQKTKVLGYIHKGRSEGARLVMGGDTPEFQSTSLQNGHYVNPTIFADCQDEMTIVREEIFGPVMAVLPFKDEQEVVARANNSTFGLAAGVFTRDLARGHRVADALEAGICWINNYNLTPIEIPFGGVKQSGLGRENGPTALDHYSQIKTVYVEMGKIDSPYT